MHAGGVSYCAQHEIEGKVCREGFLKIADALSTPDASCFYSTIPHLTVACAATIFCLAAARHPQHETACFSFASVLLIPP